MKIHKTQIRLFIFIFTLVFVFGSTSASAVLYDTINREGCSPDEIELGTCLEIKNKYDEVVYLIKAVRLVETENGDTVPMDDVIPGSDGDYSWPVSGAFTYWAGPSEGTIEGEVTSKPSAWSYIVFDLKTLPDDADPPGAQLPLPEIPCADFTSSSDRKYFKLNPSVNFKGDAIFTLYYPEDTSYDPCSGDKAYVLYGKECGGGRISPPEEPRVELRRFECNSRVAVIVQYDKCTGVPFDTVKYELDGEIVNQAVPYITSTHIYAHLPDALPQDPYGLFRNFNVLNMGPEAGTVVCTDSDPVFMWGDRGYFCSELP